MFERARKKKSETSIGRERETKDEEEEKALR